MSNMNRWNLRSSLLTRMIVVIFLTITLLRIHHSSIELEG